MSGQQRDSGSRNTPLPVLGGAGRSSAARASRTSKWRALVLAAVHLVFIAHVLHWLYAGSTLTPVEPSESMETLKTGRINAGIIFFTLSIVATLIFGRYLCGWGCHFVAYQDLCGWLMKKLGVKPRPLRARLLGLVPLGLALYMFAWPVVYRWWVGAPAPPLTMHLTTTKFWATFPGLLVASLSVGICGFAIVYFMGAKGFCTYGCPYGAFYGLADQVAPLRIRVNEKCDHTGHCSSTCTSNVDVAAEVAKYGMVVDPGCMKCRDCISVCPNDALYYGAGSSPLVTKLRTLFRRRRGGGAASSRVAGGAPIADRLSWSAEVALLLVFVAAFLSLRGLYDLFPLLMSAGAAAIVAFLMLLAVRLLRSREVTLQNLTLKSAGRLRRAGWGVLLLAGAVLLFAGHGGVVNYNVWMGNRIFARIGGVPTMWQAGFDPQRHLSAEQREMRDDSSRHFERARRWGFHETAEVCSRRASLAILGGDARSAERWLRRAIERAPDYAPLHYHLAELRQRQGDNLATITHLRRAIELDPALAPAHFALGSVLVQQQDLDAAAARFEIAINHQPDYAEAHYNLGVVRFMQARLNDAVRHVEDSLLHAPNDAQAHALLAELLRRQNRPRDAAVHQRRAAELAARAGGQAP